MDKERDMSVEDILLDYELKKERREETPTPSTTEAPRTAQPFRKPTKEVSASKPPRSAVEIFGGAKKAEHEDADMKVIPSAGQTPAAPTPLQKKKEEDTRRIPVMRAVKTVEPPKTVAVSMRTRLLSVPQPEDELDTYDDDGQLEGQLVMENFMEEPVDEEQLEEELLRRRRERVKEFRIVEGGKSASSEEKRGFKLTGEEDESDPEEVLEDPEEPPEELIEDFNEYAEADAIRSELAYRRRTGAFGVAATVGMELVLLTLTLLYQANVLTLLSPSVLTALHVALLIGMLCINHRMVAGGLKGLFTLRADADTPPAVCGVLGLLYTVLQFAQTAQIAEGQACFLSAVAGVGLLAGACGRYAQVVRIHRNFLFVGNEKQKKYAACQLEDRRVAAGLGYDVADGPLQMIYYRRVAFLERFLDNSYASDPADRVMRWFSPLVLGVSLLCAVGYALLFPGQPDRAVRLFVSAVLLSMPVWSMFAVQRAAARSAKRARRFGAMIGGFTAAEQFGDRPKVLILDAAELFPKEQVKLHGIKTFSGTRIDEAITDAAAVVIAAKGPLSPIFHRLIENRTDILREVDSLAYEQDMGLSGWVGGRRVLIGNRRLLENHGVETPSKEYEARYVREDRCVVYLSTGGELSAMFVVSYLADNAIKAQLHALEREHVRLMVRTCDPNITEALVCEVMELPVRSVEVLSASEGRVYETMLADQRGDDRAQAVLAGGGHAVSKVFAVVQSCRMRRAAWAALISQMVFSILAMLFCLFICATTGVVLRAHVMIAVIALSGVIGWLVGRLFRS